MARKSEAKQQEQSLDDWPQPHANPYFLGHADACADFENLFESNRLAHGWLITGPPGIGKATLAYKLAKRVLGAHSAHLMSINAHPDILTVKRRFDEKKGRVAAEIPVDEVRAIVPFLQTTASEGGWRIAVVDGADCLNLHGQNAILKILEEPPPKRLLFLIATNAGRLLPTIRSRSRTVGLTALDHTIMKNLLSRYAPELSPSDQSNLISLAHGSIGFALRLSAQSGKGMGFAVKIENLFSKKEFWPQSDIAQLSSDAAKTDHDFNLLAEEILQTCLGLEITQRLKNNSPRLIPHLELARLIELWKKLGEQIKLARESYLDLRLCWLSILHQLAPEKG